MSQQKPRGRSVIPPAAPMKLRTFYIVFGVILLIGIAVVAYISLGGTKAATPSTTGPTGTMPTTRSANIPTGKTDDGRYFVGKADAPVTVIEYADYQCPGCGFYSTNLEAPLKKNSSKLAKSGSSSKTSHYQCTPMQFRQRSQPAVLVNKTLLPIGKCTICSIPINDNGQFWLRQT